MIKPILFHTDMVRAILDGRKTVTRRVIKTSHKNAYGFNVVSNQGNIVGVIDYDENEIMFDNYTQPPYQPDDILYVKETWNINNMWIDYNDKCWIGFIYMASEGEFHQVSVSEEIYEKYLDFMAGNPDAWHPSIHMPKEAARIWLKVTNVRVEQLRDITEEDSKKEGISEWFLGMGESGFAVNYKTHTFYDTAIGAYVSLWDSAIKKKDLPLYGWEANPWVWVIEFERCKKPKEICL